MFKKLIIIILIDIVVIFLWAYWLNSIHVTQGESIGALLMIPAMIILTGIIGIILQFRNNSWGRPICIGMGIAFAIFFGVIKYESWKQEHDKYLTYYFSVKDKTYNLTISLNKAELQDGLTYDVYERLGEYGNGATDLDGIYIVKNDTVVLTSEKGKVMKVFEKKLFEYPKKSEFVSLRKHP